MRAGAHRVLPLSSPCDVPGGQVLELEVDVDLVELAGEVGSAGPSADCHFKPERLFVAGGGRGWEICSLAIDDREQIDQALPGELFSAATQSDARWLDTLRQGSKLRLSASYRGGGIDHFRAALIGVDVPSACGPRAFSGPIRFRDEVTGAPIAASCEGPIRVLPGEAAHFRVKPQVERGRAVSIEGLVLDLGCEEWTIEDVRVGGRGQFAAAGSVPGEVFAPPAVDEQLSIGMRLAFDPVPAGGDLEIRVTYRGPNPRGRYFGATCVCQVLR